MDSIKIEVEVADSDLCKACVYREIETVDTIMYQSPSLFDWKTKDFFKCKHAEICRYVLALYDRERLKNDQG